MTLVTMNDKEFSRLKVLQDVAAAPLKVNEAAALLHLTRRQFSRLQQAFRRDGPEGLISRRREISPSGPSRRKACCNRENWRRVRCRRAAASLTFSGAAATSCKTFRRENSLSFIVTSVIVLSPWLLVERMPG